MTSDLQTSLGPETTDKRVQQQPFGEQELGRRGEESLDARLQSEIAQFQVIQERHF